MKKSKILTPQKLISDIFIAKLKTDNFKEVTISEIVADANLSRSTFYRYFKNKHSVIEFFIEELLNDYLSTVAKKEITNFSDILIVYFEFLKENINHNFLSLMLEIERKKFLEILPQSNFPWHHNSDENELVLNLILIGGLWNISLYLLDTNQKIKPSQLASIIIESLSGNKKFI